VAVAAPTWPEARRLLARVRFVDELERFDATEVHPAAAAVLRQWVEAPGFSPEIVGQTSLAAGALCTRPNSPLPNTLSLSLSLSLSLCVCVCLSVCLPGELRAGHSASDGGGSSAG
jgi:hypothetical protein